MKLLSFILFSGVGSLAAVMVNPFAELVCFNPPQTTASVTTTAPSIPLSSSSSGWVTTNDGLVTSCNFNGANSTIWVFPTGSGNHEATKATCEGSSIVTITFVEVVVQIVKNQTTTIIPTGEGPTHSSLAPSIIEATSSSSSSLIAPTESATTHLVNIGGDGGLVFAHSQLNASIGDTVRFNFLGNNHSVTQSDLVAPCTYNGGFDSGFNLKNTSGNFTADFGVNTSAPLWFYSTQSGLPSQCGDEIVFAINPADKFDEFLKNAQVQGKVMAILTSILGAIGNASSFGLSAVGGALFNSSSQRRYLQ